MNVPEAIVRQPCLRRAVRVHHIDLVIAIPQRREGDLGAIRRPGRQILAFSRKRQARFARSIHVDGVNLGLAGRGGGKDDARRPSIELRRRIAGIAKSQARFIGTVAARRIDLPVIIAK